MLQRFLQHIAVVLCKKNDSKIKIIFEKKEHFKNKQKWPPSKGYRLAKIVNFGQKLNFA